MHPYNMRGRRTSAKLSFSLSTMNIKECLENIFGTLAATQLTPANQVNLVPNMLNYSAPLTA